MRGTASLSHDRAAKQIEDMMEQGTAFTRVEDVIETAPVPQDHKAALWLLAWSLQDPSIQLRDARLIAGSVVRQGS
jgi:hypothetical protein